MSTISFELFVPGKPEPAGSKRAIPLYDRKTGKYRTSENGKPIVAVIDDAKNSRAWKDRVASAAYGLWFPNSPLDGPLELVLVFTMPRPKGHFGTGKRAGELKIWAPLLHTTRPDATKLLRCVEDALTKIVWHDDAQVALQRITKRYGECVGVNIIVSKVNEERPDSARKESNAAGLFAQGLSEE